MVDPITGIDLEKAGIADIVNRQNVGASQRARNELIRQQTQSGKSPDLSSLYSTQETTQSPQLSNIPDMWSSIDSSKFGPDTYRGQKIENTYENAINNAKSYASYGFVPGSAPEGWEYSTPEYAGYKHKAPEGFMRWSKGKFEDVGSYGLDYYPSTGYKEWRNTGSEGDAEGIALVGSVIGNIVAPGLGISAFGSTPGSAINLGSKFANTAANGALKSFVSSGGDVNAAFKEAALGGLTSGLSEWLSKNPIETLGPIGNKVLGGAASGGLASLFTGNNPIKGALFGGMSGGLHGYLNSVNANNDPFNKFISNTATDLVRKKRFKVF